MLEGILVFLEGLLSFFSPCVIPLIPVYMGYLAGSGEKNEDGTMVYNRRKVFLHTAFFTIGISFAFFILGMTFTTLGRFFSSNKLLITRISGIFIIVLGLFQLGILDFSFLQRERKIQIVLDDKDMNPVMALIMGFTFSFAWTPCIGPALSSVLIMASSTSSSLQGYLLVFVYALGFLIPFLLLGLFTTQVLNFLKSKQKLLRYTVKAGGAILILMGVMTFTGWMNRFSSYLNTSNNDQKSSSSEEVRDKSDTMNSMDFTLTDQYGEEHTLSDYKGKVVFLNFWATWCPPCNEELPDIEALYKEYNLNQGDVVFLGITNPSSKEYPNSQDKEKGEIQAILENKGYTFPTLFDETGEVFQKYSISAIPTTFLIDKEGKVVGYVPGRMTRDIMVNVINQALQATE